MHSGNYVLITGASSGMGEATARLLAQERNLILSGRNGERLGTVGEACAAQGAGVVLFPFDLEKASEVGAAISTLLKERGLPVEAFLHFAGMTDVLPINRTKYSVGLKVMNVNYFSATEVISALLKKKVNGDNLRNIVLITSVAAYGGMKYQPQYCASKGALTSLTYALACELAPRLRINAIVPGGFKTRITQTVFREDPDAWNPDPLLPAAGVEEVAKAARFFLSADSSYITGQCLYVDGGEHFPSY